MVDINLLLTAWTSRDRVGVVGGWKFGALRLPASSNLPKKKKGCRGSEGKKESRSFGGII